MEEGGPTNELVTNSQWFNRPCLFYETSINFLKEYGSESSWAVDTEDARRRVCLQEHGSCAVLPADVPELCPL